jgi:hypothetical protein
MILFIEIFYAYCIYLILRKLIIIEISFMNVVSLMNLNLIIIAKTTICDFKKVVSTGIADVY